MGLSENRSGPARSPRSRIRSQEAEGGNRESTGAAAASGTALSKGREEQKKPSESTGLRAGNTRAADNKQGGSQEQPPSPPRPAPRSHRHRRRCIRRLRETPPPRATSRRVDAKPGRMGDRLEAAIQTILTGLLNMQQLNMSLADRLAAGVWLEEEPQEERDQWGRTRKEA